MNTLETLKEKLRLKPSVGELGFQPVKIVIPSKAEQVNISNVTILDKRGTETGLDMEKINKKLRELKLSKVSFQPAIEKERETEGPKEKETETVKEGTFKIRPKKKVKKMEPGSVLKKIEEEIEESVGEELAPMEEEFGRALEPAMQLELEEEEKTVKKRRTKKVLKGVSMLPSEAWVQIGNTDIIERLPEKKQKVFYKMSSYYMNNRQVFVNFINNLFKPYRDQLLNESEDVSCDTIGNTGKETKLLIHQKLVRDYLNLYTPYRGLFLFHSLGSGKTATSIAIAEGMKDAKKVIVMTPASLESNYLVELKKFGDPLYKVNQCWEWVNIHKNPEALDTLSSILNLPVEYIESKGGAWLVNVTKPANCTSDKTKSTLSQSQLDSINAQINKMIETKYEFIHYNGLRRDKLKRMTNNFETNIFDNTVVVIDEAHNFISRIVNKIGKEKEVATDREGKKERVFVSMSMILYELLLTAQNCRIVMLTGTPIINYPNEIGILFNILRGYIKTWEFPLDLKTSQTVNKERLQEIFSREKIMDYMDYSSTNKQLLITRNPYGFENKEKIGSGYHGVTNEKKERKDDEGKIVLQERGTISDKDFEKRIIHILRDNGIEVFTTAIRVNMFKALPDKLDEFSNWFIEEGTVNIKNTELFKRRIMGLTSYFRSAQESLLPRYEKALNFHVVKIDMSPEQFIIYESARSQERKQESSNKKKQSKGKVDKNGVFTESTSTYRIFSRLFCNFVMPKAIGRPLPSEDREIKEGEGEEEGKKDEGEKEKDEGEKEKDEGEKKEGEKEFRLGSLYKDALTHAEKGDKGDEDRERELEGDEILDKLGDVTYEKRLKLAIEKLREHASEYLSKDGLETYSPKYLHILENIQDTEDHKGLHLVYSQFRTLEGIGIFTMVLEENGFAQFKVKKDSNGVWKIDIPEEKRGLPTFALYTGTETSEEKEILRKIYNGSWDELSPSLSTELKKIAINNNMGEVIKVFMITASGSEGINLRNTRYVHIMEPYWNPARTEQVVGRARRICSHKDLPEALQTVEVFLYLMTFSKEQITSDASIELKIKDLSKKEYKVDPEKPEMRKIPFTSDETLYEISSIKEALSNQLITAVKEASIDCTVYKRRGKDDKENLHCLQFGDAVPTSFSFQPSLQKEEPDSTRTQNVVKISWKGKLVTLNGKQYIYKIIDSTRGEIYDVDSYQRALEIPGEQPLLVGTVEKTANGQMKIKEI